MGWSGAPPAAYNKVSRLDWHSMTAGPMIRSVTFDTNVFPTDGLAAQARALGLEVAVISVSAREAEGSSVEDEIRSLEQVLETGVWGESAARFLAAPAAEA